MSNPHENLDLGYAVDEYLVENLIAQNEARVNALHTHTELQAMYLALASEGHGAVDADGYQTPEDVKTAETVIDRFRTYANGTMRVGHNPDEATEEKCWEIASAKVFVIETHISKPDGAVGVLLARINIDAPTWYAEKLKTLQSVARDAPSTSQPTGVTVTQRPPRKRVGLLSKLGEAAATNPFGHGFGMRGLYNQQQADKRRKDT